MDFNKLHESSGAKIASSGTIHEEKGKFGELYATYNHLIGPDQCKDDKSLLVSVSELLSAVEFKNPEVCLKNADKAQEFRAQGNQTYKKKQFLEAITSYNRSILFAPESHEVSGICI